jgi:hypothetical protein
MAANIKILKLISREDILGEILDESDITIKIKNPVRVIVMPSKTSPQNPQVAYAPWAEFSEQKEFTIHKAHIIVSMDPMTDFINNYNQMFGGVILPTSKLIV